MTDPFPLRNFDELQREAAAREKPKTIWGRIKDAYFSAVGLKMADDFIPASQLLSDSLPRTRYPYGRDVREGLDSNVIMSPVSWVTRNFTEAEPVVERRRPDGMWEPVLDHTLALKLEEPNPFYDGDALWKSTVTSYLLDGNAYWLKLRNTMGSVVEFWYLPHFLVEPKWPQDGSTYISHYEYRPWWGSSAERIPVRDIVHFRLGLDPRNTRKGLSPLRTLLREVFTDEEAANFSASILRNMGVPGGLVSPKSADKVPSKEAVKELKDYMKDAFTGDRRGDWLVFGEPTEIQQFGFDPNQLMLANLRDISEERVCAAIGIPAAVVGFGAGLQQTKVGATMKELRRLAWVSCIIPHQVSLGRQATRQTMPEFQSQTRRFRIRFDVSGVSAFVEEETERARRTALLVEKGILRVDRAQQQLGLEVDPTQAVYLRPANVLATEPGESPEPPEPNPNGGRPEGEDEMEKANRLRALARAKERRNADTHAT